MVGWVECKQCPYAAGMVGISQKECSPGPSLPTVAQHVVQR